MDSESGLCAFEIAVKILFVDACYVAKPLPDLGWAVHLDRTDPRNTSNGPVRGG
jgi:hypothetical protein